MLVSLCTKINKNKLFFEVLRPVNKKYKPRRVLGPRRLNVNLSLNNRYTTVSMQSKVSLYVRNCHSTYYSFRTQTHAP